MAAKYVAAMNEFMSALILSAVEMCTFQTKMIATTTLNKETFWFPWQRDTSIPIKKISHVVDFDLSTVASK